MSLTVAYIDCIACTWVLCGFLVWALTVFRGERPGEPVSDEAQSYLPFFLILGLITVVLLLATHSPAASDWIDRQLKKL